jgi:hypothetical protein
MSFDVKARTRTGEQHHGVGKQMKWIALFAFMIASLIVCTAYAQTPLPGSTIQNGPAGSAPGAQAPLPGAVQKGLTGSIPEAQAPLPGAIQKGPTGSIPEAQAPLPGAIQKGPTGSAPGAQAPLPGAAMQKGPAGSALRVDEIMTAIDVSDLLNRGLSNAEIATLLSNEKGFDRASALKKGETDEQIIKYLITKTRNLPAVAGVKKSNQHENEGGKQYRESHYGKAAKEYTLAIEYSRENPEPYKLRADAYKRYLKTDLIAAAKSADNAKRVRFDQSKALLCHAIQFDYTKANALNQKALAAINADTYLLSNQMNRDITNYEPDSNVTPYHIKSAQKTHDSRRLRNLYRSQRAAIQAGVNIKAAIQDYELVCQTKSNPAR